jgi:hypothetical protein
LIGFYISAQFASNPIKALFFKALRAIEQGFQQSYPQFLGTPSKDHEKQQLTSVFKKLYEQSNDKTMTLKVFNAACKDLNDSMA